MRILLADDSEFQLGLLKSILAAAEHTDTAECRNTGELLQALDKENFGTVIADLFLPGREGLKDIFSKPGAPALLITGSIYNRKEIMEAAAWAGDFILKPFDARNVLEVLDKSLRRRNR